MHLRFASVLTAGALHRFTKTYPNGRAIEETVYDVRTVLVVDEIGISKQSLLEQGSAAAQAMIAWFAQADGLDETTLAEQIPVLPRREDSYPARQASGRT